MDQQRGLTAYHDSFAIATVINEVSFQRQDKADLYYEQEQCVNYGSLTTQYYGAKPRLVTITR